MRRLLGVVLSVALVACAQAGPAPAGTAAPPAARSPLAGDRIQILHTGDIHGKLESTTVGTGSQAFEQGGLAALGGWVGALRTRAPDRTLLLDAGDTWQGTFTSNSNKGEAVVQAMNLMKYDAQALGNHDYDWGQDVVAQRAREAKFPFLAANLRDASGNIPAYAKPYYIRDLGIARVGVIGITNPRSATIVKATSITGLSFGSPIEAVKRYLPEVRAAADIVLALTHMTAADDAALAEAVQDLDLIVAAHTHVPLRTANAVGKVRIFNPGAYTENLGRIEITIDRATKKLAAITGGDVLVPIAAGAVRPDPEIAKIVEARKAEGASVTSRVVGRTAVQLEAVRGTEIIFGNLIADGLLDYGRKQGWGSDVAFYNQAGVRASLNPGDITFGQLYLVLPFGNTIMQVDLTGEQLMEVLEGAAGNAGRLHIAGATFRYKFGNPPSQRVTAATVGGRPLDRANVYRVVMIDYLYGGGDGHTGFAKGTNVKVGDVEVDAVAAYITANSPVNPKIEGRIVAE